MRKTHRPLFSLGLLAALALVWSAQEGLAQAQYTPDLCTTGNVTCAGMMCTYQRQAYQAMLVYSNNANCTPTAVLDLNNPPAVATFAGTGTGALPRCVWSIKTLLYVLVGFCDMTGAEGLPVELMEFSVEEAEVEGALEGDGEERSQARDR